MSHASSLDDVSNKENFVFTVTISIFVLRTAPMNIFLATFYEQLKSIEKSKKREIPKDNNSCIPVYEIYSKHFQHHQICRCFNNENSSIYLTNRRLRSRLPIRSRSLVEAPRCWVYAREAAHRTVWIWDPTVHRPSPRLRDCNRKSRTTPNNPEFRDPIPYIVPDISPAHVAICKFAMDLRQTKNSV